MRSRVLIIIAALVVGAMAALLVFSFLNATQTRLRAEAQPVQILVAKEDVPKGTSIDDILGRKLAELVAVPRRYVADGAISSARNVTGQVVASELTKGEQLTTSHFQLPAQAGLAYNVPPDFVAISIPCDQFRGVAGFVKPGDSVALVGTIHIDSEAAQTRILVPRSRVLAIRQDVGTGDRQQTQTSNNGVYGNASGNGSAQAPETRYTVTVAVSKVDAERLVLVEEKGRVWLALLGGTVTATNGGPATSGQSLDTVLSYERNAGMR